MVAKEDSVEKKLRMLRNVTKSQSEVPLLFWTVSIKVFFLGIVIILLFIISVFFTEKRRKDYSSMFRSEQCLPYALRCYEHCENK